MLLDWRRDADGSLRGYSSEYISPPLHLADVRTRVSQLMAALAPANPILDSPRTSIHVHVNVTKVDHTDLWTSIMYAWLLEHTLLDKCSVHRRKNRFCCPLSQATLERTSKLLDNSTVNFNYPPNQFKYSAIALHTISSIGTVEFRSKEFTTNVDEIVDWVGLCHAIIHSPYMVWSSPAVMLDALISSDGEAIREPLGNLASKLSINTETVLDVLCDLCRIIDRTDWTYTPKPKTKAKTLNTAAELYVNEWNAVNQVRIVHEGV
jgi:hypothetical protein